MQHFLLLLAISLTCLWASSDQEAGSALVMDDVCTLGMEDDCEVSLRQLRSQVRAATERDAVLHDLESAPQFNYNWNFGCSGNENKEKPGGDNMQFNYNWNFCFDEKTIKSIQSSIASGGTSGASAGSGAGSSGATPAFDLSSLMKKKPGNCKVFGCTSSFDFMTLMNECQCFPGCDKTFLGNTCCADYHDQCQESKPSQADAALKLHQSKYTEYANADCSALHGAIELSSLRGSTSMCTKQCSQDASCEGFVHSTSNECKLLAGINIPACHASPGIYSTYVKNGGKKPPVCSKYMAATGCSWTAQWNCPGQAGGSAGSAGNDGSEGYDCCCKLGWWKATRPALPVGRHVRILNRFSNRALFAKKGMNWEDGVGAGTPPEKVGDDGVWTLIPRGEGQYRIVNQLSNRALYAKSTENWEQGWGAGSPPSKVGKGGLWTLVQDGKGNIRIISVKSQRALYAKAGGHGEMSWSGGVGAGYPPSKVSADASWTLQFV